MQSTIILNEQIELKKRQRFTLKKSTNLQIKRESKKMKSTQNAYLVKSLMAYFMQYKKQNIFFMDIAINE